MSRCEGRYPVPQTAPPREEPFDVTYRCARPKGHDGPHGPDDSLSHVRNEVMDTLKERMEWYRDGCEGLEDREGYYASGDCARDAARDLETALSEIRVLESVIAKMRAHGAER